jgi:hypothetical protein
VTRLAALVRDLPPLFTGEKPVSFDPVQMTFLQKLCRESTLKEGVTVKKEDFFQAIVYVDWFTEIVAARPALLGDIAVMVEELERIDEYLDPDLEMLVRYSGLYAVKDLRGEALFKPASVEQIARRHERANTRPTPDTSEVDLFHVALGRFVSDMASRPGLGPCLARVTGRADLRAVIAMDALLGAGLDAPEELAAGEIVPAAVALLGALVATSESWSLRAHVDRLHALVKRKA